MPRSYQATTTVTCPSCGQPFAAAVWLVVDRQERPDLVQLILAGELQVERCPHCGAEGGLGHPLLLHDGDRAALWCALPLTVAGADEARAVVGELRALLLASIPAAEQRPYLAEVEIVPELDGLRSVLLEQALADDRGAHDRLVAAAVSALLNVATGPEFEQVIAEQRALLLTDDAEGALQATAAAAEAAGDRALLGRARDAQAVVGRLRATVQGRRAALGRLLENLAPLSPAEMAALPAVRRSIAAIDPQEIYTARLALAPAQHAALDGLIARLTAEAAASEQTDLVAFLRNVAALPQQ